MALKAKPGFSRIPYVFIVLVPLLLLGLDSYGWLFSHPQPSPLPLQGLIPQSLQAHKRIKISLISREPEKLDLRPELHRMDNDERLLIPVQLVKQQIQFSIPSLSEGAYTLHWVGADAKNMPVLPLTVERSPGWSVWTDQSIHSPGDQVLIHFSAFEYQPELSITLLDAENKVWQQSQWTWPKDDGKPRQFSLYLPRELPAGTYRLELSMPDKSMQKLALEVLPRFESSQTKLQAWLFQDQLTSGFPQDINAFMIDQMGQPLETGWLQVLNQTYQVHQGQTLIHLPADFSGADLAYTAGDSHGNLQQGKWHLTWTDLPWQVRAKMDATTELKSNPLVWQVMASENMLGQPLYWVLEQDGLIIGQGIQTINAEQQNIHVAPDLMLQLKTGRAVIRVQDNEGRSTSIHWWVKPVYSGHFKVLPAQPHALNNLEMRPEQISRQFDAFSDHNKGLTTAIYALGRYVPLALHISAETMPKKYYAVGFPEPKRHQKFWPVIWFFMGLMALSMPLFWLMRQQRKQARLFPNEVVRKARKWGKRWALTWAGFILPTLFLFWFDYSGILWLYPVLCLVIGSLGLIKPLKILFSEQSPVIAWFPFLQALMILWVFWFCELYAPAFGSGLVLWSALMVLGWWYQMHNLMPGQDQKRGGVVLLACLTVLTAINGVFLFTVQSMPFNPSQRPILPSYEASLHDPVQTQSLLWYDAYPFAEKLVLPATYQSGPQRLILHTFSGGYSDQNAEVVHTAVSDIMIQAAVTAGLKVPRVVQQGDKLWLDLELNNPLPTAQKIQVKMGQNAIKQYALPAESKQLQREPYAFSTSGLHKLIVQEYFQNHWFDRNYQTLVLKPVPLQHDPSLTLNVEVPKTLDLLPGEEIPVIVSFKHRAEISQALGLQIGLPAGMRVLDDTLSDRGNQKWMKHFETTPAFINISTLDLKPDQEIAFHFRLRAEIPGEVSLPSSQLFFLEQPERKTLVKPLRLSTLIQGQN